MERIQKYKKKHDVIFQSAGGGQARHKHGGQGFDSFLEDLTPWTSQSDLLSNNCKKKIDPVKFRRTSKSISLGLDSFIYAVHCSSEVGNLFRQLVSYLLSYLGW